MGRRGPCANRLKERQANDTCTKQEKVARSAYRMRHSRLCEKLGAIPLQSLADKRTSNILEIPVAEKRRISISKRQEEQESAREHRGANSIIIGLKHTCGCKCATSRGFAPNLEHSRQIYRIHKIVNH